MSSSRVEDQVDISQKQRKIIEWRNSRRQELRESYLRQLLHPTKHQLPLDEGVLRYATMRLQHQYQMVPTYKNFLSSCGLIFTLIGVVAWGVHKTRLAQEHKYRTGQVSYVDREFKFQ